MPLPGQPGGVLFKLPCLGRPGCGPLLVPGPRTWLAVRRGALGSLQLRLSPSLGAMGQEPLLCFLGPRRPVRESPTEDFLELELTGWPLSCGQGHCSEPQGSE